jgi:hypothetical protein
LGATNKGKSRKKVSSKIWAGEGWRVVSGRLVPGRGRPSRSRPLFSFVGEKLPFACLGGVAEYVRRRLDKAEGVYLAHDSMGVARYGGRGDIFNRLRSHADKYPKELLYFSFFIIKDKKHEREVETAFLRAASSQMVLNQKKVRTGLEVGNVADYEPGTEFIERQRKKGKKARRHRGRRRKVSIG